MGTRLCAEKQVKVLSRAIQQKHQCFVTIMVRLCQSTLQNPAEHPVSDEVQAFLFLSRAVCYVNVVSLSSTEYLSVRPFVIVIIVIVICVFPSCALCE